jgi:class 3 adenylate cyclase
MLNALFRTEKSMGPDRSRLREWLLERNAFPARAGAIDAAIWAALGRRAAVLVLDMSGFSRLTSAHGVIHFLSMVYQMEAAATPAIQCNGGRVIKQEADNLFALFETPAAALEAALDILRAFAAMNVIAPGERAIYGSVGIGYGDLLVIDSEDLYGAEMNFASKLGEDVAEIMDIWLTPAAYAELRPGQRAFSPMTLAVHGVECHAFRLDRPAGR